MKSNLRVKDEVVTGYSKKSFHESEGKTALKNEDDLAESSKFGTCATTSW